MVCAVRRLPWRGQNSCSSPNWFWHSGQTFTGRPGQIVADPRRRRLVGDYWRGSGAEATVRKYTQSLFCSAMAATFVVEFDAGYGLVAIAWPNPPLAEGSGL